MYIVNLLATSFHWNLIAAQERQFPHVNIVTREEIRPMAKGDTFITTA